MIRLSKITSYNEIPVWGIASCYNIKRQLFTSSLSSKRGSFSLKLERRLRQFSVFPGYSTK
jgi:hypothetical protein